MRPTQKCLRLLAGCLSAFPWLSGCIVPYPHTTLRAPEVSGTVLDARTGAPIKGVQVVQGESPSTWGSKPKRRTATTDASGRFVLPKSHNYHWGIGSGGERFDDLPPRHLYGLPRISHSGYLPYSVERWGEVNVVLQPVDSLEVVGTVLDLRTMAPIVGAKVYFASMPRASFCTSDTAGRFKLKATAEFYNEYRVSSYNFEDWVAVSHRDYGKVQWHCGTKGEVRGGNMLVQLGQ